MITENPRKAVDDTIEYLRPFFYEGLDDKPMDTGKLILHIQEVTATKLFHLLKGIYGDVEHTGNHKEDRGSRFVE